MSDLLTRAIRSRDLQQARWAISQLQQHLNEDGIRSRIWAAIERLAWEEGDRSAATWLLKHSASDRRSS